MGMRVMDGVMLVGSPADSELLATALSPDCGELGPSPFMRESGTSITSYLLLRKVDTEAGTAASQKWLH